VATIQAAQDQEVEEARRNGLTDSLGNWLRDHERTLLGTIAVVVFLGVWERAGTSGAVSPLFISAPSRIWAAFVLLAKSGELGKDVLVSGQEFLFGFGLAILVGIPLGVLMGWYRRLDALLDPFVNAFNATPRIALLPLLIIWLGIGVNSKIAIVFIGAVFAILISTISGIHSLDQALIRASRSFGASDIQMFRTVALPGSVPFILSGIRLGLGHALVGVVVGELYGSTAGIGYLISLSSNNFQTDKVFVGVAIVAGAGVLFTILLRRIESHYEAWRPKR
jgi:ABC-type nitrate/sulfonate/bicarbonate transport system permease component